MTDKKLCRTCNEPTEDVVTIKGKEVPLCSDCVYVIALNSILDAHGG